MAPITDIPVEILIDNVFPYFDVRDLMNLASTCKSFNALLKDDMFWKRKLEEDFNFTPQVTARTSGWQHIYKGMRNPRIYVWGERSNGRLGTNNPKLSPMGHVPSPLRLKIPGVRVVDLVAGGMSFHALDSEGNVHVWGALDGSTMALNSDGFSQPGKEAHQPLKLSLPSPTRAISCGRLHAATLDSNKTIWNFLNWGRPFRLASPLLDCSSPDSTPHQVECGWSFTSVLTKSGDVLVWFPWEDALFEPLTNRFAEMDDEHNKRAVPVGHTIPCVTWELHKDPVRLPALPQLPILPVSVQEGDGRQIQPQLIHIGGADNYLVGLTDQGHVLRFAMHDNSSAAQGSWTYLPRFSEVQRVQDLLSSSSENATSLPRTWKITHISAHFNKFTTYSTDMGSVVLTGDASISPDASPEAPSVLQNKEVISVILGDYHQGALTAKGELYTWGQYSKGALGLGDPGVLPAGSPGGFETDQDRLRAVERNGWGLTPPNVEKPAQVSFSSKRRTFCFSACASGWHTGALVIDLDENDEGSDDSDEEVPSAQSLDNAKAVPDPSEVPEPGTQPTILRGRGLPFRIGHAGRGMGRGGGLARGQPPSAGSSSGQGTAGVQAEINPLTYFRVGFAGRGRG